jgi:hypothetical protein
MAGMKSKGGRRGSAGASRKAGAQRKPRAAAGPVARPADQIGTSRIHLTRIIRDGAIWNVVVATTGGDDATAAVLLEFERTDGDGQPDRYATPLTGRLRDALYGGGSVSRADLVHELELAIRTDAARTGDATAEGSRE